MTWKKVILLHFIWIFDNAFDKWHCTTTGTFIICQQICRWHLVDTHRTVWSKDALRSWLLSREKYTEVTPLVWARSNRRRHCPVWIFHTYVTPKCLIPHSSIVCVGIFWLLRARLDQQYCIIIQFALSDVVCWFLICFKTVHLWVVLSLAFDSV